MYNRIAARWMAFVGTANLANLFNATEAHWWNFVATMAVIAIGSAWGWD